MLSAPGATSVSISREEMIGRRVALISITVGAALAIIKVWVGVNARSTSVLSDGLEAAGDVLSSTIVLFGLLLASKPPDYEHPYGHGRYETLAGLAVGGMLLLAGAGILWHSISSLNGTSPVAGYALYPLLAAVVIKLVLAVLKFRVGKRVASTSLQADAWHDVTDLLSTCVALAAVGATLLDPVRFGAADHIGGIVISVIIFFVSMRVVRDTIGQLLDTMPEASKMAEIKEVALSVPGSLGIEKCFARRTGLKYHVDLHLEVDPEMTVRQSHEIATRVRFAIIGSLKWVADVLVHVEPATLPANFARHRPALERTHGE